MNILSITGADDSTNIAELKEIQEKYPHLEFGILYLLERQGIGRNPSFEWRKEFLRKIPKEQSAIHICAAEAFRIILQDNFKKTFVYEELLQVGRIQLNINSRHQIFTHEEIHKIYMKLMKAGFQIILQYNDNSKQWILPFLEENPGYLKSIDILLDSSLGRGVVSTEFKVPEELKDYSFKYGFAGGLSAENIVGIRDEVLKSNVDYWLDLESGARTNNLFDLEKVRQLSQLVFSH